MYLVFTHLAHPCLCLPTSMHNQSWAYQSFYDSWEASVPDGMPVSRDQLLVCLVVACFAALLSGDRRPSLGPPDIPHKQTRMTHAPCRATTSITPLTLSFIFLQGLALMSSGDSVDGETHDTISYFPGNLAPLVVLELSFTCFMKSLRHTRTQNAHIPWPTFFHSCPLLPSHPQLYGAYPSVQRASCRLTSRTDWLLSSRCERLGRRKTSSPTSGVLSLPLWLGCQRCILSVV